MDYNQIVENWKNRNIKSSAELSEALNAHAISFAYNSGKIENENISYYDTREIFEHDGVSHYTGDLRTLFEIRNSKNAYEFLLKSFENKTQITEDFIKELQRCLTLNTYDDRRYKLGERPGEYKKHDYITGRNEVGVPPEDVSSEVQTLLKELNGIKDEHALTAAAYFHAELENIHPFADGNGRTGRLAMNYFLILHNHPPITIHEEDRKEYYESLEAWDTKQDLEPLKRFLVKQTEKTWTKGIIRDKDYSLEEKINNARGKVQQSSKDKSSSKGKANDLEI